MVYIFKKTVGNKEYYYLRASERRGSRVISKDIAYLGSSASEARKALAEIPKYKDEIEKACRKISLFLDSNHFLEKARQLKLKNDGFLGESLFEVEACKLHYGTEFRKKDDLTKKETMKNFLIEFSFNTASIEGNTISLKEAYNLLEEGIAPKGKTLREIYDLQNTEKVFNELNMNETLGNNFIQKIHSGLMEKIDSRTGYRRENVQVRHSRFDSTPWHLITTDMNLLMKWFKENEKKLHPFVLAVIFHHKFEKIHPFMDGNGRTGRMLLNFILMKKGYPPMIIRRRRRDEYLDALSKADLAGLGEAGPEYRRLAKFCAEEMQDGYWGAFL